MSERDALQVALAVADALLLDVSDVARSVFAYERRDIDLDSSNNLLLVLRALSAQPSIDAEDDAFRTALKEQSFDLARRYDSLSGKLEGLYEEAGFYLGLAIGSRLGRDLLERAAFPRRNGGAS